MTSSSKDRSYHEGRALAELRCADDAGDPAIANIHRELAALHKRRTIAIAEPKEETGAGR